MLRLIRAFLLFLCGGPLSGLALAATPGEVEWYGSDFAPLSIVSGPYKGRGAIDQWQAFIVEQLAEWSHQSVVANTARIREALTRHGNVCNPAYLKTPEREQYALFSEPLIGILPNGLITLQQRKAEYRPFLNSRGELKLQELMAARPLRLAVANGRSFGAHIDGVLQHPASLGKRVPFNASDLFSSGLLQLSARKQLDAVMGYAMELSWNARRLDLPQEQFWFVPIEGESALIPVHVACSRSPLGEQVIRRVNQLIRAGKLPELAAQAYREWLPADVAAYYDLLRKSGGH